MTAKRTVREIKTQADLMSTALQLAQVDIDPATLKIRLLAAVLQAESYKKLPQWRQASLQGFCEGLAIGRGISAGEPVELPQPAAMPPSPEEQVPPASQTRELQLPKPDIAAIERLYSDMQRMLAAAGIAPPSLPQEPAAAPPASTSLKPPSRNPGPSKTAARARK